MRLPFGYCSMILASAVFCSSVAATDDEDDLPPLNITEWLDGPGREDFPWKVKLLKPRLTLQQRNLVQVQATIDGDRLKNREHRRDLHFVLKVADSTGRWFSDYSYTHSSIPPGLQDYQRIRCDIGLYLRPGRYTVALIVYDTVLEQGNIWRKQLKVKPPGDHRLPELDRDLPVVEFLPGVPQYAMDYDQPPSSADSVWPLGQGMEWLPVNNNRYLCIDIIVNVSFTRPALLWRYRRMAAPPLTNYHINASHLMQVSSVLSHLKLQSGCVRLSILDALRMRTLYDRVDAAGFDWQQASEVVQKQDQLTVGVDELSMQGQASAYLQDQLNKVMKDTPSAHGSAPPFRTIIIVSREQRFPVDTKIKRTVPQNPDDTRFFYFRIGRISYASDALFEMLKPEKPRRFGIRDGGDLRKALSKLISDLEELG